MCIVGTFFFNLTAVSRGHLKMMHMFKGSCIKMGFSKEVQLKPVGKHKNTFTDFRVCCTHKPLDHWKPLCSHKTLNFILKCCKTHRWGWIKTIVVILHHLKVEFCDQHFILNLKQLLTYLWTYKRLELLTLVPCHTCHTRLHSGSCGCRKRQLSPAL